MSVTKSKPYIWVLRLVLLVAFLPLLAQREPIRVQVELVVVPVSVHDSKGTFVDNLRPENFRLLEDGRRQEIRSASVDLVPLSVAVLIDQGMNDNALGRFAEAIPAFSSALANVDEAAVYPYHPAIDKASGFTSSQEEFEKKLRLIRKPSEGRTGRDMNDALFTAAIDLEMRPVERRRVIVVIMDGVIGEGLHSMQETQERLVQAQIQMYGVLLGQFFPVAATSMLRRYADPTGGDVYRAPTQSDQLKNAFVRIMDQARHQYVLTYASNNIVTGQSPVSRRIEVRVNRRGVRVSDRKTYLQHVAAK